MSIRDNNKVIIISNAMTGQILIQIPYDNLNIAEEFIRGIVMNQIKNDEGILIKIGNRA